MEKIESDVRIEDIPDGVWREFTEQHGTEPILGLVEKLGVLMVYILGVSSNQREFRSRETSEGHLRLPYLKNKYDEFVKIKSHFFIRKEGF